MKLGQQINGTPGRGVRRGLYVQHVCRFDDETCAQIRAIAVRDRISLSEAVRVLVEFGLQSDQDNTL